MLHYSYVLLFMLTIFYDFMSSGSPAIQAFELIPIENYYLSNFTFKKHMNFFCQRKFLNPQGNLLVILCHAENL